MTLRKSEFIFVGLFFLALVLAGYILIHSRNAVKINISGKATDKTFALPESITADQNIWVPREKSFIAGVSFYGNVSWEESLHDKALFFSLFKKTGWGYAEIRFKEPLDLLKNTFSVSVKGKKGVERVNFSLTDYNKWTSFRTEMAGSILTPQWQQMNIGAKDLKAITGIDKSKVVSIKVIIDRDYFEGPEQCGIYLKDISFSSE
ncbi:MAG: hypothetical protein WDL87_01760 [Candidatus Omnitrophota bacterium]|jgi:hypothetical protein